MADTSTPEGAGATGARPHRVIAGTLFALATIIGVVAVLAVWTNRQALNTENWTNTSAKLLADKPIQTALSGYLVTQLFSSGAVEQQLTAELPPRFKPLAGPASSGLEQVAGRIAPQVLASSQVQSAWQTANRLAHEQLLKILNGGSTTVSTAGGVVTLNVRALVDQLAARLGVQEQVAAARSKLQSGAGQSARAAAQQKLGVTLPSNTGQLRILKSDQLKTAQDVAQGIKGLAIVLPLVMFALFILAVWLSRGRRRLAVRTTGWCFLAIGLIALLARRAIGNHVVDALVQNPANKTAVHHVWTIGTSLLYDIGAAMVVYGLIFVFASLLAGPSRPATAVRRALAPSLRDHPVSAYAVVGVAYLLVIVWGPTPAFRQAIPLIGIAALIVLGLEALRRQTAREFPDARPGDTFNALRAWYAGRRRHSTGAAAPNGGAGNGHLAELERLANLHDRGVLNDAEFEREKLALTGGGS